MEFFNRYIQLNKIIVEMYKNRKQFSKVIIIEYFFQKCIIVL